MTPRGLRNNNPMNIRHSKIVWQGQSAKQTDKDFVQFDSMIYGVRAGARNLLYYQEENGYRDTETILSHWAPATENDTNRYIADVCKDTGLTPTEWVDLKDEAHLVPFVRAIVTHEVGAQWVGAVSISDLVGGCYLALNVHNIEAHEARLTVASNTVKGPP